MSNGSKKDLIMTISLLVIVAVIAVILLKQYVFTGSVDPEADTKTKISVNANELMTKSLDTSFLDDPVFLSLRDIGDEERPFAEIKTGKDNPFVEELEDQGQNWDSSPMPAQDAGYDQALGDNGDSHFDEESQDYGQYWEEGGVNEQIEENLNYEQATGIDQYIGE